MRRIYRSLKTEADEFMEDYKAIVEEHALKDAAGELVVEGEKLRTKNDAEFDAAIEELGERTSDWSLGELKPLPVSWLETLDDLPQMGLLVDALMTLDILEED